ncbi:DELTA-sagatoxin-Srs1a-like isoform X2 [Brachionichthys hirsutus]
MSESAEALAASLTSSRNVTIEINNTARGICLADPKVYLESGGCHSPPQPTVRPLRTEVCNFTKTSGTSGAVGVLTYDIYLKGQKECKNKLAIMFSVPYDNSAYKNWVALGIFDMSRECDKSLYKEMYYNECNKFVRQEANGSCVVLNTHDQLDVMCTMSPLGRAIMKVEVWDKTDAKRLTP